MLYYLKVVVVWVVTQNRFVSRILIFRRNMPPFSRPKMKTMFKTEDGGSMFLRNAGIRPES
jgi:hypothetical protein